MTELIDAKRRDGATLLVTQSFDADGIEIISVPLQHSDKEATLYLEDWNELLKLGCIPLWKFYDGHVYQRTKVKISIARLVSNALKGEKVSYRDGSPFNLKTNNLVKGIGAGKETERNKLNLDYGTMKPTVVISYRYISPSWNPNYYNQ
jgi:hypothetical protein